MMMGEGVFAKYLPKEVETLNINMENCPATAKL